MDPGGTYSDLGRVDEQPSGSAGSSERLIQVAENLRARKNHGRERQKRGTGGRLLAQRGREHKREGVEAESPGRISATDGSICPGSPPGATRKTRSSREKCYGAGVSSCDSMLTGSGCTRRSIARVYCGRAMGCLTPDPDSQILLPSSRNRFRAGLAAPRTRCLGCDRKPSLAHRIRR